MVRLNNGRDPDTLASAPVSSGLEGGGAGAAWAPSFEAAPSAFAEELDETYAEVEVDESEGVDEGLPSGAAGPPVSTVPGPLGSTALSRPGLQVSAPGVAALDFDRMATPVMGLQQPIYSCRYCNQPY